MNKPLIAFAALLMVAAITLGSHHWLSLRRQREANSARALAGLRSIGQAVLMYQSRPSTRPATQPTTRPATSPRGSKKDDTDPANVLFGD